MVDANPSPPNGNSTMPSVNVDDRPRDSKGWDGKLRVDKKALITNPEALSDPDYSDEDAPPVDKIEADEGELQRAWHASWDGELTAAARLA
jgi:hypothetical protein